MNGGQILECMEKIVALLSIVVEVTVKKGLDKGELLEIWRKLWSKRRISQVENSLLRLNIWA